MNREFWGELLKVWLKSIGCENFDGDWCSYKEQRCRMLVSWSNDGGTIDLGGFGRGWAYINLKTQDVDPCNPSFDPGKFFAPLLKWLDK